MISFEGEEYIQVWDYDKGCGLFNKNLEMLLPVEYKEIEHSEEYECIYAVDQYNVRHYFDKNGKELFPVDYYTGELSDDGLIAVASEKGSLIYDAYGTLVDSLAYTVWGEFSHGLIIAYNEKGMVGYLDENGDVAIDFQFEEAEAFSEDGIAAVRKDGKWGFIDEAGRAVAECMYDDVGKFSQGRAAVCREGKWGFIDCLGEEIIPLQFESVEDFSFTEAIVTVSGANEEDRNVINYVGEIIR